MHIVSAEIVMHVDKPHMVEVSYSTKPNITP